MPSDLDAHKYQSYINQNKAKHMIERRPERDIKTLITDEETLAMLREQNHTVKKTPSIADLNLKAKVYEFFKDTF